MANPIAVAPIGSADTGNNRVVLDAQAKAAKKSKKNDKTTTQPAPAADKVVLSTEAKAASASTQAVKAPEVESASNAISAAPIRDMQSIQKDMGTVIKELERLNVSDKDVSKALKAGAAGLDSKATSSIQKAIDKLQAGEITEAKFAKTLDKIAADQAQGVLNALKGLRDQAAKPEAPVANTAIKVEQPVVAKPESPVAKAAEQVAKVAEKAGEQITKIVEKAEEKTEKILEKAEETGGRFVGTASAPGLSGSNGSNGPSALSAFADNQLEKITERLSFLQDTVSALKKEVNSNGDERSAFNILRKIAGRLDRTEGSVSGADISGAALKVGDLEDALGSLISKVQDDRTAKRDSGTFLQGGFGFGTGGGVASGGPTIHSGKDTDHSGSVAINASAGIGLGSFGASRRTRNNFGSLVTSFGGVRQIGGAVSGSKLSVVA
ncbi:MAG: hypothetical protein QGF68_09395 [Nitrospinota bacterium]|nr:hypothetical protein [Nitrospinota bacterium]